MEMPENVRHSTLDAIAAIAEVSKGPDKYGYRDEFVKLVRATPLK